MRRPSDAVGVSASETECGPAACLARVCEKWTKGLLTVIFACPIVKNAQRDLAK
jgi:hypothetical protein